MKNSFNELMAKAWFRWFFIPLLLFISSFFFLMIFAYSSKSFILLQNEDKDVFTTLFPGEILAGEKVSGEFTAMSDFIGIVSVRFNTYARINNDILTFRIKEKGDKKWYYENIYKVDQFQPNQLFPFGFPPIQNSKNKVFQIEIESAKGKYHDAVAINTKNPVIVMSYQLPVSRFLSKDGAIALLTYKQKIITFIFDAIASRVQNFIILFLPPILYLTLMAWRTSKFLETFANIVGSVLLGYIFLIGRLLPDNQQNSVVFIIVLLFLIAIIVRKYKMSYVIYFVVSIFFILLMSGILITLHRPDIADRSALFAYLFLLIGTFLGIIERKKKVKKGSLALFFNDLWIVKLFFFVSNYVFLRSLMYRRIYTKFQYEINKIS
ncbi:MAG: hypothetical protein AAB478_02555 [Patescibacteria group bacterium]